MEPRISLVTLGVEDLPRARNFYLRLGFPLQSQSNENVAFFALHGLWLSLYGRESLAEDVGCPAEGRGFRGITLAHNVRTREEVAQVLAEAEAAGGKVVKPAQDVFWGGHSGYFSDPDGFFWEVAWNPHFWIE
ncbi:MAG: glyoxalase [Candidatus Dactylopiibacterium carminicum]|uniref:Glyoxalase n=1 Tax=Candidatus Dactylopiibacterium carminicum TaxID=857335 RepID=A0A272EUI3_9RHOO|nr:VOC family protein [Candidatus Dactylopiibacterium carminicum]PAS93753.1 MAG: glyoxalase [Candidatus Dactylopiibacterium carminicum]PAS98347.1 MAG: glyoxalase [Candidatus Dactylopiibacterium carminicum]PAS99799.1 MAG: glyoxalase [Candidatus Dactylopiibacterium carminicum]